MAILILREIATGSIKRRAAPMQAQGFREFAAGRFNLPADPIRHDY